LKESRTMGTSVLLPLLLHAAFNNMKESSLRRTVDINDDQVDQEHPGLETLLSFHLPSRRHEWRSRVEEVRKKHQEELQQWTEEEPFKNEKEAGKWQSLVDQWGQKPEGDHDRWQETAWGLLKDWVQDESPSSVNFLGSLNGHGSPGMIHLTSRVTTTNGTEERVATLPSSSLLPLLKHLASSPLFLHYAPMALPIVLPIFLVFLLLPLLPFVILPLLFSLLVVPLIALVVSSLSMAGSSLLPIGISAFTRMATGAVESLEKHHLDTVLERLAEEEVASLEEEEVTTTLAPSLNTISHTEVPRMMSW